MIARQMVFAWSVPMSVLGPGCVKTLGEKAFAQQWNRTSGRRKTLLRLMGLTRINLAQNLPGNSFYTAWVKIGPNVQFIELSVNSAMKCNTSRR
jgi:hypothetical protein